MSATPNLNAIYALLRAGDGDTAAQRCQDLLRKSPDDTDLLSLLGFAQLISSAYGAAVYTYSRLIPLAPPDPAHWNNLGLALRQVNRNSDAEAAFMQALQLAPGDANALHNLGTLAAARHDPAQAQALFLKALEAAPDRIESRVQAALMAFECGDNALAQNLLKDWQSWISNDPEILQDVGWMLAHLGDSAQGEELLRRAVAGAPDPAQARARLVQQLERANRLEDAAAELALLPDPSNVTDEQLREDLIGAQAALALREREPHRAQALLDAMLQLPQSDASRAATLFHAARLADRRSDTATALAYLHEAHALQQPQAERLMPNVAHSGLPPLIRAARRVSAESFRRWPTLPSPTSEETPTFVMGFPRSGTTMLETMLDSHPALSAMDEQPFLQDLTDAIQRNGFAYPADLDRLTQVDCEQLRAAYWRRVIATGRWQPGRRLVDKNPLNFLCLPLLKRIFPGAKLVMLLRHPGDVLLSCYMQNFRSPAFALMCASLEKLAQAWRTAMEFWVDQSQLLQPDSLELRYEDLLHDFPGRTAQLAQFLGLDDAQSMLLFHQHAQSRGYISTPSYSQVVRPPDASRIGRWRAYRDEFMPLEPVLAPLMRHWDYRFD